MLSALPLICRMLNQAETCSGRPRTQHTGCWPGDGCMKNQRPWWWTLGPGDSSVKRLGCGWAPWLPAASSNWGTDLPGLYTSEAMGQQGLGMSSGSGICRPVLRPSFDPYWSLSLNEFFCKEGVTPHLSHRVMDVNFWE